jgi:hypothetical protein
VSLVLSAAVCRKAYPALPCHPRPAVAYQRAEKGAAMKCWLFLFAALILAVLWAFVIPTLEEVW